MNVEEVGNKAGTIKGAFLAEPAQRASGQVLLHPASSLTCLWVDLWREVWRGGARGEVFVAVGDEGGQGVHVVGVLHHRDLVRLQEEKTRKKRDKTKKIGVNDGTTREFSFKLNNK